MARLDGAVLLDPHTALRDEPVRFALGCRLLELMGRLAPEGAAPPDARRLFAFALDALRMIAASKPDARLRLWIELRALDALGLRPEFRRCVRCADALRPNQRIGFLIADGGPVCGACAASLDGLFPVQLGTLRALEQCLRFELARLPRLTLTPAALDEARTLITRFARFHLGVELRSERFLDEIMRDGPRSAA
jgi:DNA repair protein RecO (recombination protein O)